MKTLAFLHVEVETDCLLLMQAASQTGALSGLEDRWRHYCPAVSEPSCPAADGRAQGDSGDDREEGYHQLLSSLPGIQAPAGIMQPSAVAAFHTLSAFFFKS